MVENIKGTFEIHLFVAPLNPDQETVDRFVQACERATTGPNHTVKGLFLYLDFEHLGYAGVLQSSRYTQGTIEDARRVVQEDCEMLEAAGFEVIRRKIECLASNEGVPRNEQEDKEQLPGHYFEFHIKCVPTATTTEEEGQAEQAVDVETLKQLSEKLSKELNVRIPLSYNALRPSQRFLNTRTYGLGRDPSFETVEAIRESINALGHIRVEKVIREFICQDDNTALDAGWLEPLGYQNKPLPCAS
ncbi:2'-5' RNA ligase superfamily protein [Balamuthia mandrillaris]